MGIFRQEYWSELPCPPPGDLPNSEIEPISPESNALQVDSLPTEPQGRQFRSLGQEDALEEGMATHSSILA